MISKFGIRCFYSQYWECSLTCVIKRRYNWGQMTLSFVIPWNSAVTNFSQILFISSCCDNNMLWHVTLIRRTYIYWQLFENNIWPHSQPETYNRRTPQKSWNSWMPLLNLNTYTYLIIWNSRLNHITEQAI